MKRLKDVMKVKTISSVKNKICSKCKLKQSCGDVPGLCMALNYGVITSVMIMLTYFLVTMDLD